MVGLQQEVGQDVDAGFDAFYRAEFGRLAGALVIMGAPRPVAEDLAQEAMYRAYRSWARVAAMVQPAAWLHTVGVNLLRRRHRHLAREAAAGPSGSAQSGLETEAAIDLRNAVADLPFDQRAAVVLRHVLGYPTEEAAGVLGRSEEATRALLHRAMVGLRTSSRLAGEERS